MMLAIPCLWNHSLPEFEYDEERYLFEFDPWAPKFHQPMNYQSLLLIARMTGSIMKHLSIRIIEARDDRNFETKCIKWVDSATWLNKYQLDARSRIMMNAASVRQLLHEIGGEVAFNSFQRQIRKIIRTVRNAIKEVLCSCVPSLPDTALELTFLHLIHNGGVRNLGMLSMNYVEESCSIKKLYQLLGNIFEDLKRIMFNVNGEMFCPTELKKLIQALDKEYNSYISFISSYTESLVPLHR